MPAMDELVISTVFASGKSDDAASLMDRMQACGLGSLELEYRITGPMLNGMLADLKARGLGVASVHNFCPLPVGLPRQKASGDLFNLVSRDSEERRNAVKYTIASLETADRAGARAVVLHLGWVEGLEDKDVTRQAARQGGPTPEMERAREARAAAREQASDEASFALERLIKRAQELDITLGLENRYHLFQVPDFTEAGLLLERFAGGPVGYWHDVGHAFVRERAGLTPAADWLAAFGPGLAGCHLHDASGARDHQLPGQGELDWDDLARDLKHAPIKVLEIAPGPEPEEVAAAAEMVAACFDRAGE